MICATTSSVISPLPFSARQRRLSQSNLNLSRLSLSESFEYFVRQALRGIKWRGGLNCIESLLSSYHHHPHRTAPPSAVAAARPPPSPPPPPPFASPLDLATALARAPAALAPASRAGRPRAPLPLPSPRLRRVAVVRCRHGHGCRPERSHPAPDADAIPAALRRRYPSADHDFVAAARAPKTRHLRTSKLTGDLLHVPRGATTCLMDLSAERVPARSPRARVPCSSSRTRRAPPATVTAGGTTARSARARLVARRRLAARASCACGRRGSAARTLMRCAQDRAAPWRRLIAGPGMSFVRLASSELTPRAYTLLRTRRRVRKIFS
jgi:hypothetical protein